jgi:hypothetical protein
MAEKGTAGMKFCIPETTDAEQAERVWQATKKFAEQTLGWQVTDRRIFRLTYIHGADSYQAGRPSGVQPVLVILESNAYLVCTPTGASHPGCRSSSASKR